MKHPLIPPGVWTPPKDTLLEKILLKEGAYYRPADLYYHELWHQRLEGIGMRVLSVERLPYHPVWHLRLRGGLTVQNYLLLMKLVPGKMVGSEDLLSDQLASEIRRMAREMGPAIPKDALSVMRTGEYFQVSFVWPWGRAGLWLKPGKKLAAFSLLLRPWLRRRRN